MKRSSARRATTPVNMRAILTGAVLAAISLPVTAEAAGSAEVTLTLKNHRFTPATFPVPADQKVRITLVNEDPAAEEFDSHDLRVEQVVTPMATISFTIGPLKPGQYSFMGEFHAATAQGQITVR
jgi:plastocyanin